MEWILETEGLRWPFDEAAADVPGRSHGNGFIPVIPDLRLAPGGLARVDTGDIPPESVDAWFDTLTGLRPPDSGRIRIAGEVWERLPAREQDRRRGRIRRVDFNGGWISNLDIVENITLSERHHTRRASGGILRETGDWARRLGLAEMPAGRPAHAGRRVLRRAQWVRAMLGAPDLILIAAGAADFSAGADVLAAAVEAKRSAGAAILWAGPFPGEPAS